MVCSWGRVIRFIEAAFDLGLWIVARVSFAYRCEITRWELGNSEPCIPPLCNYLHPLRREATSSLDVIFVTISRFVAQQEQWKSISIRTIISELNSWILLLVQLFRSHAFNPLNPELNPICYLLALLGAHRFLHVSRIRVKLLTLRRLMSCIYGAPILDVSRSHTTTQHSR